MLTGLIKYIWFHDLPQQSVLLYLQYGGNWIQTYVISFQHIVKARDYKGRLLELSSSTSYHYNFAQYVCLQVELLHFAHDNNVKYDMTSELLKLFINKHGHVIMMRLLESIYARR